MENEYSIPMSGYLIDDNKYQNLCLENMLQDNDILIFENKVSSEF